MGKRDLYAENRFRDLLDNMLEGFQIIGFDWQYLYVNTAAAEQAQVSKEALLGHTLMELNPGITQTALFTELKRCMDERKPGKMETGFVFPDGREGWFELNIQPVTEGIFILSNDITERKQIDQALRHRTTMMEALTQTTLDLVNRHEMDDILQTLLAKMSVLLDAPVITFDLVENEDTLVMYAGTSNQPLKLGNAIRRGEGEWLSWKVVETGEPIILEDYAAWSKRRPLYDGYSIHATMIVPIHLRERVIGVIDCARTTPDKPFNDTDIFAAKQLAQMVALVLDNANLYSQLQVSLKESMQREETLRATQGEVIDQHRASAMLEERQRLARDLHDSVSQSIHSLMLFSETLVSTLEKNNVERARQISERLQESARQALKETRLLLYQSQVSFKGRDVNLIEELNARLSNVELRAGVRAQIIQEGSLEHCPKAWYENLFWITIEALNNSLKHAQARSVQISLRCFPNYVELEVSDNGKGFDLNSPGVGGYGLRNMQERANLLGGSLTFTSDPQNQNGTTVLFHAEIKEPL